MEKQKKMGEKKSGKYSRYAVNVITWRRNADAQSVSKIFLWWSNFSCSVPLRLHGMMNMFVNLWNSAFQHPLQYLYLSLFGCCPYHKLFDRIEYYLHWHIKVWYNSNFYSFSFRQKSCKNCWQEMFSALDSYWTLWGRGITWQNISIIGNGSLLNG